MVEAGYVEVVYGGTKEGAFLTNHDLIRSIHLTGSTATYDAVVWGGKKKVPHPADSSCFDHPSGMVTERRYAWCGGPDWAESLFLLRG